MAQQLPTRFLASLLRIAEQHGADPDRLLRSAGIAFDPRDLQQAADQPTVDPMLYSRLYQQVLRVVQDETFSLAAGAHVDPGAFRMMCYCLISAETLGEAVRCASDFYRTFYPANNELQLQVDKGVAQVGYPRGVTAQRRGRVTVTEGYGLSVWHRFFGWLCGRSIDLQRVDFRGSTPRHPERYTQLFQCPIQFDQASDVLLFDDGYLALPVVHTEQSLRDFLRTAPYQLLVMESGGNGGSIAEQLRVMIGHDYRQGFPSFDTLCAALGVSAPTLRRKLKAEGTSFQKIKDGCRCEAAKVSLQRSDAAISEVARQLGFTDPSAFHRSFKKWTGQTPGEFRYRALPQH